MRSLLWSSLSVASCCWRRTTGKQSRLAGLAPKLLRGGGAESNSGEEEFGDFQGGDPHPGEGYAALGDGSDSEDFANDFEDEAGNPHASNKGWWNEAEAAATVSGVNAAGSSDPARYGALSAEEIKTIKDVMSSLDIPAPPWAKALDDRILQEQMSSLVARNRAGIPPS